VSERASSAVLELRALKFRWPRAAHDCIDIEEFEAERGERIFLHGPSGCGKTTLLSLLGGVLVPGAGELRLLERNWASLPAWQRDTYRAAHVGFIFQQFNLLPYLSAIDNALLPCRLSDRRAARSRERFSGPLEQASHLLEAMQLPRALWHRKATELSVGQQQRVAAARALLGAPELVLADEPTSALDEERRAAFLDLLLGACRESRATLIFVSHDLRIAARFDRALALPSINRAAAGEIS